MPTEDIPFVDVTVRPESLHDDLFKISRAISPTVRREEVIFEELKGGLVNLIHKLSDLEVSPGVKKSVIFRTFDMKFNSDGFMSLYTKSEETQNGTKTNGKANGLGNGHKREENGKANGYRKEENGIDNRHKKEENGKMEEMNGNGVNGETDKAKPTMFNRATEYLVMHEVSKCGLCPPVYARYQNGYCYGYTEGTTVTRELMISEEYLQEAASKFARFHSIKHHIPNLPSVARHDRITGRFQENFHENVLKIGEQIAEMKESQFLKIPKLKVLIEYDKRISKALREIGLGKVGLCHNDPNQKNLIWNSQAAPGSRLGFLDLEMTSPNYLILDLAYNWRCFGGYFSVGFDGRFFPSSDYRRRFLTKYLQEFHKHERIELSAEEFESELEDLFHRVSLAAVRELLERCVIAHVFEVTDLLKNVDEIPVRAEDQLGAKYALGLYQTFLSLYPQVLEDALKHFENKSGYGAA